MANPFMIRGFTDRVKPARGPFAQGAQPPVPDPRPSITLQLPEWSPGNYGTSIEQGLGNIFTLPLNCFGGHGLHVPFKECPNQSPAKYFGTPGGTAQVSYP